MMLLQLYKKLTNLITGPVNYQIIMIALVIENFKIIVET